MFEDMTTSDVLFIYVYLYMLFVDEVEYIVFEVSTWNLTLIKQPGRAAVKSSCLYFSAYQ